MSGRRLRVGLRRLNDQQICSRLESLESDDEDHDVQLVTAKDDGGWSDGDNDAEDENEEGVAEHVSQDESEEDDAVAVEGGNESVTTVDRGDAEEGNDGVGEKEKENVKEADRDRDVADSPGVRGWKSVEGGKLKVVYEEVAEVRGPGDEEFVGGDEGRVQDEGDQDSSF